MDKRMFVAELERRWTQDPRWRGITRPYSAEDVWRLAGTVRPDHTLARRGAARLWQLLEEDAYTAVLSAITGNQAIQEVQAGLKAIYLSGWQVAGDMNSVGEVYPDQSLYPADSAPTLVRRLNNALLRADQIHHMRGDDAIDWLVPIVADAEAGFGGILNAYELVKHLIEAGAAGVHLEDQLASLKKCGHLGGKVLVPTSEFINKLVAGRLAADVCGVDTVLIARTDALSATILANDIDPYDHPFLTGERTPEGFDYVRSGIEAAIARALAYASYADVLWFETSSPDLAEATQFAEAVHAKYPGKLLSYNCSPSFNWKRHLSDAQIASFQRDLGRLGYQFQFVTLSAFHSLNYATFELATRYRERGMAAYADLQEREFAAERDGYEAVKHQQFVGAGYFDEITQVVTQGRSAVMAMAGSTEEEQFVQAQRGTKPA
jgi:isocitrate lyase